jgi:hypothetical protein
MSNALEDTRQLNGSGGSVSRGSNSGMLASLSATTTEKSGFPLTITHLGRSGANHESLNASVLMMFKTEVERKGWHEAITIQSAEITDCQLVFETRVESDMFFSLRQTHSRFVFYLTFKGYLLF